jgi:outer membrane immunogenic protein
MVNKWLTGLLTSSSFVAKDQHGLTQQEKTSLCCIGDGICSMKTWSDFLHRLLLCAAVVLTCAALARADESSEWNGFYAGFNIGAGRTSATSDTYTPYLDPGASLSAGTFWTSARNASEVSGLGDGTFASTDLFAGGAVGYNWRIDENQVVGAEVGISSFGLDEGKSKSGTYVVPSSYLSAFIPTVTVKSEADYFIDFTTRYGRVVDDTLFYLKAGGAVGRLGYTYEFDDTNSSHSHSYDTFQLGWTLGVGVERYVSKNWIFRLEYQHIDFGDISSSGSGIVSRNGNSYRNTSIDVDMGFASDVVRVGLFRSF